MVNGQLLIALTPPYPSPSLTPFSLARSLTPLPIPHSSLPHSLPTPHSPLPTPHEDTRSQRWVEQSKKLPLCPQW
ncbi:hypothetical protein H6G89_15060 [Oscillatoria sp. FACHB-1407]|uniref:hypothetical protein n=1 Tax=Oscillatoria sp. FACHB-1407 TaxID=2692847 RepID=UPI001684B853|nr:hypothetical protein [Oscillatoria sp. FACHB-1407]MBD2462364.1 hypothetical protein [Oscillatoria sp. FACHB-1407]